MKREQQSVEHITSGTEIKPIEKLAGDGHRIDQVKLEGNSNHRAFSLSDMRMISGGSILPNIMLLRKPERSKFLVLQDDIQLIDGISSIK
ncbi:MAG: hypothetical protein ACHQX1_00225 [Candidatus Micrarchaeales archaeon]